MKRELVMILTMILCFTNQALSQKINEEKVLSDMLDSKIKYEESLIYELNAKKNENFKRKFTVKYPNGIVEIKRAYMENVKFIQNNSEHFVHFFQEKKWKDDGSRMAYNYIDPVLSNTEKFLTTKTEYYKIVEDYLLKNSNEFLPAFLYKIKPTEKINFKSED